MAVQKDAGNDDGKSVWVHMCKLYKMCLMLDAMQLPSTRIKKPVQESKNRRKLWYNVWWQSSFTHSPPDKLIIIYRSKLTTQL
jgi:hypothetical protein